jgi:hypothetical protein
MTSLDKYQPGLNLPELRKAKTVELCIASNAPTLAEIRKIDGEDKLCVLVEMWILDINEYFNLSHKMNERQIKETARYLIDDFYHFKVVDVNYIFTQAKKGKYGVMYNTIDGSKIYSWFENHNNERANLCYDEKLREHHIQRSNEEKFESSIKENSDDETPMPESLKNRINKIGR